MTQQSPEIPEIVIERWSRLPGGIVSRVGTGLINDTYMVTDERARTVMVQRLHPVFSAEVNNDIAAVTTKLRAHEVETPELIATDDGELWVEHGDRIWRALTYVPGHCHDHIEKPAFARGAGEITARFHSALADFEYEYQFTRSGVHDIVQHMASLKNAMSQHPRHKFASDVTELAANVLSAAANLPDFSALPARHSHGDLKTSNILFHESGDGVCLIDLDTLGRQRWPLEMGDALRSWCNPLQEDDADAHLDLAQFEAAVEAYAAHKPGFLVPDEIDALVPGIGTVTVGLAARFLTDVLENRYFGWSPEQYASRGEHNLARASAMLHLYRDVRAKSADAQRIVTSALA